MLPAAHRMRSSAEFATTIRRGRRAGRGVLVVHLVLPTTEQAKPADAGSTTPRLPTRAGFVVPKAVGRAVVRNRLRRRLRHLVRERLHSLPPGSMLVVRALPGAAEASYARLGADLDAALAAARSGRPSGRESR
ncbi:MAG TPA: ribonuclease P protein component [Micromonospora sp.]